MRMLGFLAGMAFGIAAAEPVVVFEQGRDGYTCFRIPAVISTKDGGLLAFCEGRKNDWKDHGDIDLVMKRSDDGGLTWGGLRMVDDGGGEGEVTIGNPVPVLDSAGVVHLVYCRDNSRIFHVSSADGGRNWGAPVEITAGLRKEDWGWYATGPCHGILLREGKQKGRLVIPANHRIGKRGDDRGRYGSHVIYSDDSGKTWKLGAVAGEGDGLHPNETTAVELVTGPDGGSRILFNTRNNGGTNPLRRASAVSGDGGATFAADYRGDAGLDAPVCQGSILGWNGNTLFLTTPRGGKRENLTLWKSTDQGEAWLESREIFHGPAAYSDLVRTADGKLGVIFENGGANPYERISFERLAIE